jgi:hypothetical protein
MRIEFFVGVVATASLVLAACNDKDDVGVGESDSGDDGDGDDDDDDDGTPNDADSDGGDGPVGDSSSGTSLPGGSEDTSDDDPGGFIQDPDGGGTNIQCDIWGQDCNAGEKCMPWANDGGSFWNATKCVPIERNPAQVGDPCVVDGSGVSGLDDCDKGAMCWDVDPETNQGTCVELCTGNEANPVCGNPITQCVITNDGVLILCLPTCDPITPDTCSEGQACYPVDDNFACIPDASGEMGAYSDACEFINVCDPGLFCADATTVPGCASAGCCSSFCDLTDPDASANCPGAAGGQECTAWYEEGSAPPNLDDLGACVIPA